MSIPDFVKILELKRYSKNTIDNYIMVVKMAEQYFNKPLNNVNETALHPYFYFMVHTKKVSYSYQKQIAMALKLYYKEMFNTTINLEFLFPSRKPKKLPVIIAKKANGMVMAAASNHFF